MESSAAHPNSTPTSDAYGRYQAVAAAAERLHAEIGGLREVEAARAYLREVEALDLAVWNFQRNYIFFARYEDIGAALIAGRGREIADRLSRVLQCGDGNGTLIAEADPAQLANSDWISLGWMRILRGDWTPLPDDRGAGRLPVKGGGEIVAPLLDLAAARDRQGALALAQRVAAEYEEPSGPSVLVAGLRRVLPPPLPQELADPGLFFVSASGAIGGRGLPNEILETPLDAYPLRAVKLIEPQEWADPAGGSWSVILEGLDCGHRRATPRSVWTDAGARRCPRCGQRDTTARGK